MREKENNREYEIPVCILCPGRNCTAFSQSGMFYTVALVFGLVVQAGCLQGVAELADWYSNQLAFFTLILMVGNTLFFTERKAGTAEAEITGKKWDRNKKRYADSFLAIITVNEKESCYMEQRLIATNKLLEEFVIYLTKEERSKATVEKYERDVVHFMKFIGTENIITRESVLEYKESILLEYSITSVNSMLAALNQFLMFIGAFDFKVKRINMQKQVFREEERELTEKEYKSMVQKAYQEGKIRLALIMETICSTGIRISELQYFTVKAVKMGRIEIYNKGKVRVILVPDQLKKKLLCYIGKMKLARGSIFVTAGGKAVDRSNIWREMKSLGADVKILAKKVFPHNLRHLFAVIYYRAYRDIISLADILGHSSVETTRVYTATTGAEYKKRLESLSLVLK